MNNKGFAISGILYTILIIFVVSISIMLFNLQNRKTILDELKTEAVEAVESDNNYEYLLDRINQLEAKLGTEDISGVGDGTVNGAISSLSVYKANESQVLMKKLHSINDCNKMKEIGIYNINPSITTNIPTMQYGQIITFAHDVYITQMFISVTSSIAFVRGTYDNGENWSDWLQITN